MILTLKRLVKITKMGFIKQFYYQTPHDHIMRPFITIEKKAKEALDFYSNIFTSFSLVSIKHHAEPHEELVMLAVFSIDGQEIMISDSLISHEWSITPGISFFLEKDDEDSLKHLAESLGAGGKTHMPPGNYGFSTLFAWVEDKFGVNWQINVE